MIRVISANRVWLDISNLKSVLIILDRLIQVRSFLTGSQKSLSDRLHSFIISMAYFAPEKFPSVLLVPTVNFTPAFFALLMKSAEGILYLLLISIAILLVCMALITSSILSSVQK